MTEWKDVLVEYNGRCAYCGKIPSALSIDHKVPASKGGRHVKDNVVPACLTCNQSKKDRPVPPVGVLQTPAIRLRQWIDGWGFGVGRALVYNDRPAWDDPDFKAGHAKGSADRKAAISQAEAEFGVRMPVVAVGSGRPKDRPEIERALR